MSEELKSIDDTTTEPEIEKKYFEDLIVLGNAVPDEISRGRIVVCTVAFSKEHGLIRIYLVPTHSPMKRWNVISIPLERNRHDNRNESWKIQGSRSEWSTLSSKIKIKGTLQRKEWIELIEYLKEHHSYGCIEDINDKKLSLGIIIPKITDKKLAKRKNIDTTTQASLDDTEPFLTINNYKIRPTITYECPRCRTKKGCHVQGILEWGVYEYIRNSDTPEQVWDNLHIGESGYDQCFLVGNMNQYRSKFLIISIFRYKI